MTAKGNTSRFGRLTAGNDNPFSGKYLQGFLFGKIIRPVKLDGLAGTLVLHPQGMNVVRVCPFEMFQKKVRPEQIAAKEKKTDGGLNPSWNF